MTEQEKPKSTFWKRASKILKKPFIKKPSAPIESSEFESESDDYSEDEYSSDSYSESDSDASIEKLRVAAMSSQAHLNSRDVNNRYALRRQPKPSLKALEAKETEKREKERKQVRKFATLGLDFVPSAPLYPNLTPSPTPQPVADVQSIDKSGCQVAHRPVENFQKNIEVLFTDGQTEICNAGANDIHDENGLPLVLPQHNTLEELVTELNVKYNYSRRDASRLAQEILKTVDCDNDRGGRPTRKSSFPYNFEQLYEKRRVTPAQTDHLASSNTNTSVTRQRTTPPPVIPPRTLTPNANTPPKTTSNSTLFLTPQQMVERYLANSVSDVTHLPESQSTPFIPTKSNWQTSSSTKQTCNPFETNKFLNTPIPKSNPFNNQNVPKSQNLSQQKTYSEINPDHHISSQHSTNPFQSTNFQTPLVLGRELSEEGPVNTPFCLSDSYRATQKLAKGNRLPTASRPALH